MFNKWYLARNTYSTNGVVAYPTELTGMRKFKGCCYYKPNKKLSWDKDPISDQIDWGMRLTLKNCKKIFGHCPKGGELLCVTKTRKGWKSRKIDLKFSREAP